MLWLIRLGLVILAFLFTAPHIFEPSTPQEWSIVVFCDLGLVALSELARITYEARAVGEMNVRKRPKLALILFLLIGVSALAVALTHLVVSDYKTAFGGLIISLLIIPRAFTTFRF